MYIIKKEKDEIRKTYLEKRRAIDHDEKVSRDSKICVCAMSLASYRYAEYILLYAPTDDEVDILPVAEDALKKGKRVAFPRCNTENHTMNYHIINSLDDLKPDSYGIREPDESLPIYDRKADGSKAICFVPGLVYDKRGYRLGYGKGFYDRYLSEFSGNIIGVVYSDFILDEVPRGRFDVNIKILLTEKGVRVTGEN